MTTATNPPAAAPVALEGAPQGHRRAAGLLARLWRGRAEDARWVRPAFLGLLLATAVLYVHDLGASGYANSFYSAAAQAGGQSWKALFFGSLDAGNAITVDKPPAALWPMALSVRLFGLSSWAILLPQALMGVATVAVLYAAVRRRFSAAAGLIAGAVLALTPVAALMFRFNNPDALLALLMTVTVYCVLRALEHGRTKWLVWAGVAVGLAFLAKTLQAFLILPPLAVLYAVCAPVRLPRRLRQLALSGLATVVAGGWWVAVVELWPEPSRPYVGGSQHNSFLELTFGYNGLGRINGEETGSVGGGGRPGGGGRWGETGLGRMFNSEVGGQISWLLPAALILLVAGLVVTWRARRTDTARAAFVAWGGSLLMTSAVFSFMAGIFHQYYTVALAPYLAALVGMGATVLWEERAKGWAGAVLGLTVAVTAWWAYELLGRTPDHVPWLRTAVLVAGLAGAAGLLLAARLGRRLALTAVGLGLTASLAGPVAYTLSTVDTPHTGSIVTAGPPGAGRSGGPGGGGPGGPGGGGDGGGRPPGQQGQAQGQRNQPPGQQGQGGQNPQGQPPGRQGQGRPQQDDGQQNGQQDGQQDGRARGQRGAMGGGMGGGMGGLLNGAQVGADEKRLLEANADRYTWAAAAIGAQNAASHQLATGEPVMAIGGFNGSDPSPTLAQFKSYVADGRIHYFIAGGGMGGGMGGRGGGTGSDEGTASQISTWVTENYTEVTAGDATFYDLTEPKS
ncbi:glycosyltransferase family 39 protein [Streptomyces flavofungini]|uniref:glycosyltransferase family 39 protein n=1 Tax=Streptomyces flavofungini TaxID=68200 RepID=UPI0025B27C2B|nr:glycosyltransferase family 39 protein [Streptomyces flavofungini]WJV47684.1 glycosyltransferase family 39 protein [Streptomyces flavofungini]